MGLLTTFFETERKETKGHLRNVLIVANGNAASEAMVRMLEVYYARDEEQEKYVESHRPQITLIDTASPSESHFGDWKPTGMEYTTELGEQDIGRIALQYQNGKIFKTNPTGQSKDVGEHFTSDSRGEATSILWNKRISSYAEKGSYDVVLYADTATHIASKVLGLTSQGRGFTIPWECGTLVKMPNSTQLQSPPIRETNNRGICRSSNERSFRYRNLSLSQNNPRPSSHPRHAPGARVRFSSEYRPVNGELHLRPRNLVPLHRRDDRTDSR
jgi:hypothetical protein